MTLVESFLNSRPASQLALLFSRLTPEVVGYHLADWISGIFASLRKSPPVRAVRANQWIVSGRRFTAAELDQITRETFRLSGYSLYDFYHNLNRPQEILRRVEFTPNMQTILARSLEGRHGTLFVLPHMGNFDMAGRALALRGVRFQVLSYPRPSGGYKIQNRVRRFDGIDVTPMSVSSMRDALQRLMHGGTVMTGVDRPLPDGNYRPRFFGIPTGLPVAHIRMAIKAAIPIFVGAVIKISSGHYILDASEPIPMKTYPDLKSEMERNAEAVLENVEELILRAPQQWAMYYPVWPDAFQEMP